LPDWRLAIWATLPFLLFPSGLLWFTQITKDAFSIAGVLVLLYGWLSLAKTETWDGGWRKPGAAGLWVILGAALTWVARPYIVEMMQGMGAVLAVVLTVKLLVLGTRRGMAWHRVVFAVGAIWILVVALTPFTQGTTREIAQAPGKAPPLSWQAAGFLPSAVDSKFHALAVIRNSYLALYPNAASLVDPNTRFHNAGQVLAYLPRAAEVALLAPFPNQWLQRGSSKATTLMRREAGVEMVGVYLALFFLPYAIWRWRRRVEAWLLTIFGIGVMTIYAITIPDVGTLYRERYAFLMTLVALGVAGCVALCHERKGAIRSPERLDG
jgi:hypothetical protein